jgi:hypothetical protein
MKTFKELLLTLESKKDTELYHYKSAGSTSQIKRKSGTFVGYTQSASKGKGANILKHNETGKYYAAGGSSSAFTAKTTLHDTPKAAARAYHKGNLAEAEPKNRIIKGLELLEAKKNGKTVQLNKPFRTSDGKGKFAVYTKNDKGNVVKVNFGDTTGLTIKTSNPDRRRSFRARHNCDDPGPKYKARYWSCKAWSKDSVSAGLGIK